MLLNLKVNDPTGKPRGAVKMTLDFAANQWTVDDAKAPAWQGVGCSGSGSFELKSWPVMWIWDQAAGKPRQNTIIFWDPPTGESDTKHVSGRARIFDPAEPSLKEGMIDWSVDTSPASISPARSAMLKILSGIPKTDLSSDDADFKKLTGFDTARLKREFWDVETIVDPKDPEKKRMIPNPNRGFTTCNAFLGNMAAKLAASLGTKLGTWLGRGVLKLDLVDKDVKGSWVPVDKTGKVKFQVGDFYSRPLTLENGQVQVFGHVGIVGAFDGTSWTSLDGGQGGRKKGRDFIKWVSRGKYDVTQINGWCDIDVYFAAASAALAAKK